MKKTNIKKSDYSFAFSCLIIVIITLTLFNISYYLFSKPKILYVKKDLTNSEISFWQTFLASHPSYLEGWVELAKLNIVKGDKIGAEIAYQKAIKIDPNSVEIQGLKDSIRN